MEELREKLGAECGFRAAADQKAAVLQQELEELSLKVLPYCLSGNSKGSCFASYQEP